MSSSKYLNTHKSQTKSKRFFDSVQKTQEKNEKKNVARGRKIKMNKQQQKKRTKFQKIKKSKN